MPSGWIRVEAEVDPVGTEHVCASGYSRTGEGGVGMAVTHSPPRKVPVQMTTCVDLIVSPDSEKSNVSGSDGSSHRVAVALWPKERVLT